MTRKGLIAVLSVGFVALVLGAMFVLEWTSPDPRDASLVTPPTTQGDKPRHPVQKLADCLGVPALAAEQRDDGLTTPLPFNPDCRGDE